METDKLFQRNHYRKVFTREQKLVAAVWYHERLYTGMSYEQLAFNFKKRFNAKYPGYTTLKCWEKELFKKDYKNVKARNLSRLAYVPYVRESLVKYPDLTMKARSQLLGISFGALKAIFENDLTPSDFETLKNKQVSEEANNSQDDRSENSLKLPENNYKENKDENT